jgi:hypothetical protein
MININDIRAILNPKYIVNNTYMEEKAQKMRIDISYSKDYILFQSDKKGANYLECFHSSASCVNRKADYIIITEKKGAIHCLIIELKKTENPKEQLELTEYFVEFIFKRIFYKYKKWPLLVIRKIGAFKDALPNGYKGLTRTGKIYNNGFAYIKGSTFNMGLYL